jgi:hypothetical protein
MNKFILDDLYFEKIGYLNGISINEELCEFFDYIRNHRQIPNLLITQFSEIHILYIRDSSKRLLEPGEIWWDKILSEEMYSKLNQNKGLVIGFMVVKKGKKKTYDLIDYIDTRMKGYNLAEMMIERYESMHRKKLFPEYITESASDYWKKHLKKNKKLKFEEKLINNGERINWEYLKN